MFWLNIHSHHQAGYKTLSKKTKNTIQYNSGDKISSVVLYCIFSFLILGPMLSLIMGTYV